MSHIKNQLFVIALFASIFAAWLAPEIGIDREPVSLGDIATWGVGFIFFFYGLRLDRQKLREGLVNTRLHILVHLATFVLFPAIVFPVMYFCGGLNPDSPRHYLWIGAYFLATLPSTVSSSVVMVSIAKGNMPAAIFNASVSSLLGVFMTPLLMTFVLENVDGAHGLADVVVKLVIQVLLPVALGILFNAKFGTWANRHKILFRNFDQTIILLIVYTSFCDSFYKKMFADFSWTEIAVLTLAMVALFFFAFFFIWGVCRILHFNREDTITAIFCGSKKSLAHGSVMSKVLFSNPAVIGIVLLPTMIYHAMQLLVVSAIAKHWGAKIRD